MAEKCTYRILFPNNTGLRSEMAGMDLYSASQLLPGATRLLRCLAVVVDAVALPAPTRRRRRCVAFQASPSPQPSSPRAPRRHRKLGELLCRSRGGSGIWSRVKCRQWYNTFELRCFKTVYIHFSFTSSLIPKSLCSRSSLVSLQSLYSAVVATQQPFTSSRPLL
jgi:hypothetical protein